MSAFGLDSLFKDVCTEIVSSSRGPEMPGADAPVFRPRGPGRPVERMAALSVHVVGA